MSFIDERTPKLEHEVRKLRAERDALREEVSLRRHSMPTEYAKLLAERDALAALLREALDAIENHATQRTYAGGVVLSNTAIKIRAALKDKP